MSAAAAKKIAPMAMTRVSKIQQSAEVIEMTIRQHVQAPAEIQPEDCLEGDRDMEAFLSQYGIRSEFA